jgi:hypothetical protein
VGNIRFGTPSIAGIHMTFEAIKPPRAPH